MDFTLALGELFTLVVYGHLILEQARLTDIDDDLLGAIFDVLVRDFSEHAVQLHGKRGSTEAQQSWALSVIRKPVTDNDSFERVWRRVAALSGGYEMKA
jgi:acyl-CoA dehydrogenase